MHFFSENPHFLLSGTYARNQGKCTERKKKNLTNGGRPPPWHCTKKKTKQGRTQLCFGHETSKGIFFQHANKLRHLRPRGGSNSDRQGAKCSARPTGLAFAGPQKERPSHISCQAQHRKKGQSVLEMWSYIFPAFPVLNDTSRNGISFFNYTMRTTLHHFL